MVPCEIPMLAAMVSALHVLGLGLGLGAVFARGVSLRALDRGDAQALRRVLFADGFWGVAAALWIVTGGARLFGQTDKGIDFYLYNGFFWVKMGLFGSVFALELLPMATCMRWRSALRAGAAPDTRRAGLLVRLNDAETVLVMAIPFVAAMMARGLWLFA